MAKEKDKGKQLADLNKPIIESKVRVSDDRKWLINTIQIITIKPVAYLKKVLEGSE